MARIRSIKPEFWTDPDIVAMPMAARLFLIGCWNHADDYGVLRDDPERLRLQIMPADPIDAVEIVDELVESRFLVRMIAPDGTALLVVRTFTIHQKIDKRAVGRWGHPDDFTPAESHRPTPAPTQSPPIPTTPTPGGEGTGLDGTGLEQLPPPADVTSLALVPTEPAPPVRMYSDEFERWWSLYPRKVEKAPAFAAWKVARRTRTAEFLTEAVRAHGAAWQANGTETKHIVYPERWLKRKRYDEEPERISNTPMNKTDAKVAAILNRAQA